MCLKRTGPFSVNGSAAKCELLCDQESQCEAWVINLPECKFPGHATYNNSVCWLKASRGRLIKQACRVCGKRSNLAAREDQAAHTTRDAGGAGGRGNGSSCTLHSMFPEGAVIQDETSTCGHWATKLMLNSKPAPFLAGILSQGYVATSFLPKTTLCGGGGVVTVVSNDAKKGPLAWRDERGGMGLNRR